MNLYRITGKPYRFFHGKIKLNEAQANARRHALKPLGDGIFEIISPIEFKIGEELGFDGEVNKAMLQDITPVIVKAEGKETPSVKGSVPVAPEKKEPEKKSKKKK